MIIDIHPKANPTISVVGEISLIPSAMASYNTVYNYKKLLVINQ